MCILQPKGGVSRDEGQGENSKLLGAEATERKTLTENGGWEGVCSSALNSKKNTPKIGWQSQSIYIPLIYGENFKKIVKYTSLPACGIGRSKNVVIKHSSKRNLVLETVNCLLSIIGHSLRIYCGLGSVLASTYTVESKRVPILKGPWVKFFEPISTSIKWWWQ